MSPADLRIDQICLEFENRLRDGDSPSIEEHLAMIEGEPQRELFFHLMTLTLDYQSSDSDRTSENEESGRDQAQHWIDRFPGFEEEIGRVFSQFTELVWHPPSKGDHLGRYRIGERLGQGSFGFVYEAWDQELERSVALKTPRMHRSATRSTADQFCREIRSLAKLRHPNVMVVYDVVRDKTGWPWMVLERLESTELGADHDASNRIDDLISVARGLEYIHRQGVVHRDLKPQNVLQDSTGRTVLVDFGLALQCNGFGEQPGISAGSSAYMSPEQVLGRTQWTDGRADIWAFGVMLYERICGRRPFSGNHPQEIAEAILESAPQPPRQIHGNASEELERICLKCLRKAPEDRYATAGDLLADLQRAHVKNTRRERWRPRLPWIAAAAALILMALLVVSQRQRSPRSSESASVEISGSSESSPAANSGATLPSSLASDSMASDSMSSGPRSIGGGSLGAVAPNSMNSDSSDAITPDGLASRVPQAVAEAPPISSGFETTYQPWISLGSSSLELIDDAFQGHRSVKVDHRTSDYEGVSVDLRGHIELGKIYCCEAYVKSNEPGARLQMNLDVTDPHGTRYRTLAVAEVGTGSWVHAQGLFLLPAGKPIESLWLTFRGLPENNPNPLHSFQVDSVRVMEMKPIAGAQLLRNEGFEEGTRYWTPITDPLSTFRMTEDHYDGAKAIRISDRKSGTTGPCQRINVEVGAWYYCQARVKAVTEEKQYKFQVQDGMEPSLFRRVGSARAERSRWKLIEGGHRAYSSTMRVWVESVGDHTGDFLVDAMSVTPLRTVRTIQLTADLEHLRALP